MTERYRLAGDKRPLLLGKSSPRSVNPYASPLALDVPLAQRRTLSVRREQAKLALYALAIVGLSVGSDPAWLMASGVVILAIAGRDAVSIARRALLATVTFTGFVSLAYILQSYWLDAGMPWRWLHVVNLRVLDMSMLTFLFIRRVNLSAALSFSKRLSFLLVLTVSQSISLRRTLDDFRLGLSSRVAGRATLRDRYRASARAAGWLLDRALANAHESAQALQSRGLFR